MAQNENALGAPTEGLGQTVTFALKGTNGAPQIDALGPVRVNSGVSGGQGAQLELQGRVVDQPKDPTMALLLKVADRFMAPQIEKQRKEAFLTGMQKARAGQALLDIAEEQPWYSKIFGEGDVVAGARAFTQQTKAQETVLALQEQMPELRKRGLDEARSVMSKAVDSAMTGDAETDMFLMNSFTRTLPSLMATHAREHYKYTQEQAVETHGKMLASGARLLQDQAKEHFVNNTDSTEYDIARAQYLGLVAQPAGMDDEAYQKALSQHILATAENGDFHAIKVLRDAGAIELLPEKMRAAVVRSIDVNERQLPSGDQADQFTEKLYNLRQMAHQIRVNDGPVADPEVLRREYEKLNADWMRVTGSSRPMVGAKAITGEAVQMADEIQQALDRDHRERLAAAKEAAKEAKMNRLLALQERAASDRHAAGMSAWNAANPASLLFGAEPFKEQEVNAIVSEGMGGLLFKPGELTPAEQQQYFRLGAFISAGSGDNMVKTKLAPIYQAAKLAGSPATPQFAAVYDNYLRMKQMNPLALGKMFDEQTLKELNTFNLMHPNPLTRDANGQPQITMAAAGAFASAIDPNTVLPKQVLDKTEQKALVQQIVKDRSFWRPEMLGADPNLKTVTNAQAERIARRIGPSVEAILPTVGGDIDMATKQAWSAFEERGGRVIGGYELTDRVWRGKQLYEVFGQGRKDVAFPNEPATLANGFRDYIKQRVATVGGKDADNAIIQPIGDGKGFAIITTDRDGKQAVIPGSYGAVGDLLNQRRVDTLPGFPSGLPISEMTQEMIRRRNER